MKRKYRLFFVPILVVFLLLASTPPAKAAGKGPFYVGVFGGYVMPKDLKVETSDAIVGELSDDIKLDNSWMMGAKFGYIIPAVKWLAAELEYTYLAKQDVKDDGDGNFSANNLMANLVLRYPEGIIHPYAGFGIGWSRGQIKGGNPDPLDEKDNAFAWQLLAGLNLDIKPNWSADLGYRYFQCKYEYADNPKVDATSKNHMFLIGVNYHF